MSDVKGVYGGFEQVLDDVFEFRVDCNCELKRDCFLETHYHVKPAKEKHGAAAPVPLSGAAARVAKTLKKENAAPRGYKVCSDREYSEKCSHHMHSRHAAKEASRKYHARPCSNPYGCDDDCLRIDRSLPANNSANLISDIFFQDELNGYYDAPSAYADDIGSEEDAVPLLIPIEEANVEPAVAVGGQSPLKPGGLNPRAKVFKPVHPVTAPARDLVVVDVVAEVNYADFISRGVAHHRERATEDLSERPSFKNPSSSPSVIGSEDTVAPCEEKGSAPSAPTPTEPTVGVEYKKREPVEESLDDMLANDLEARLQVGFAERRVVVPEQHTLQVIEEKSVETTVLDLQNFAMSPEEITLLTSYRFESYSIRLRLFYNALLRQQTVETPSSYAPRTNYSITWRLLKKLPFTRAVKNSRTLIREVNVDGNETESLHFTGFFVKYIREKQLKVCAPRDEYDVMDMNRLAGFAGTRRVNVYIELFAHLSREPELLTRPAFTTDYKAAGSLRFLMGQLASRWEIAGVAVSKFANHDIWNNTINHFYALKCVREMENRFSEPNAAQELVPFRPGITRGSYRPGVVPFDSLMSGVR